MARNANQPPVVAELALRKHLLLVWTVLIAIGCSCDDDTKTAPVLGDPALRNDARLIVVEHCGSCHMQDSPSANKQALSAVDFTKMEWAASIDPLHRVQIVDQLRPEPTFGGHHGAIVSVPPGQYMVVRDYIASVNRHKENLRHKEN